MTRQTLWAVLCALLLASVLVESQSIARLILLVSSCGIIVTIHILLNRSERK